MDWVLSEIQTPVRTHTLTQKVPSMQSRKLLETQDLFVPEQLKPVDDSDDRVDDPAEANTTENHTAPLCTL